MTKKEMREKVVKLERRWDVARKINDHAQAAELSRAIRQLERKLEKGVQTTSRR